MPLESNNHQTINDGGVVHTYESEDGEDEEDDCQIIQRDEDDDVSNESVAERKIVKIDHRLSKNR